jgi:hypothetical protein
VDNRSRQKGEAFSGTLGPAAPRNASTQIYSGPRRDRGFESCFLRRPVCLTSAFHAYRRKDPAFAGSVSLDETRERDVLAPSRLALAAFL